MMKFSLPIALALVAVLVLPDHESSAFAPASSISSPNSLATTTASSNSNSNSALSMGIFDMFSKEAKEAREKKKRMVIQEQERLQKEIIDRRRNPDKMEEYEIKTQMRRELRMEGKDDEAVSVAASIYDGSEDQTLLNGAKRDD